MSVTTYIQGHDSSTLSSHQTRSAEAQADYLLPHIKATDTILDVGCGPGTITCGLAKYVPQGKVIGVDYSEDVLQHARSEAEKQGVEGNVEFKVASALELPFDDGSFDIVHCHAVLVHLPNASRALKEMRRVCKVGGFVAAREPDWESCVIHPCDLRLERWKGTHMELKRREGAEPNAGRFLAEWALEVGFEGVKMEVDCDVLKYFGSGRKWWGELYAERMKGEFGKRAVDAGLATDEEVDGFGEAWIEWSKKESGIWALVHMKLLCRK